MSSGWTNANTKINEVREKYLEELKLNIRCDEGDDHTAVFYCPDCKANLCFICSNKIHSMRALSKHEVVLLTEKPEPPIYCYLHPQIPAELICKKIGCSGKNKPICAICHKCETHKDHDNETLVNEYEKIRANITNCLEKIVAKQRVCDKNMEEYDKCISTYSTIDADFMRSEIDKIEKFYIDAKNLALKNLFDFANNRTKTLELLKSQYGSYKTKLDQMSSELRNIEVSRRVEVIENGENVENLKEQAGKELDPTTDLIPSSGYSVKFPNIELLSIEIDIKDTGYFFQPLDLWYLENDKVVTKDLPVQNQSETLVDSIEELGILEPQPPRRIPAVCFIKRHLAVDQLTGTAMDSEVALAVRPEENGKLYTYHNDRSVLYLEKEPIMNAGNVAVYKYIAVLFCFCGERNYGQKELRRIVQNNCWSRIIVVIEGRCPEDDELFLKSKRILAALDKRVEITRFEGDPKLFDPFLDC